jgi:gamma-glutamyl hercynylcysteine S-oxide synthase
MRDADPALHDPAAPRIGSADLLSLALIEARNRSLRWLSVFEAASAAGRAAAGDLSLSPPLWLAGHAGWFQEYWIARHVQRQRGAHGDATRPRLASIEPHADRWWHPGHSSASERWSLDLPDFEATRRWLVDTLETTLELLGAAGEGDDALYFFRAALMHEDGLSERFSVLAQALGIGADAGTELQRELWPPLRARAVREPLCFASQRWMLGSEGKGFVPDLELPAHEVALPEFEIDAQAVNWAQFVEFVDDGGYEDPRWWSERGAAWLQAHEHAHGQRCPRYVEQMRQSVLVRRQGRLQRVPLQQPALHVSAHEAEAWCRWAGRRIPTEPEWELAASQGASRGMVWGEVWEWVAGSARLYPGHPGGPLARAAPLPGALRVQRGASWLSAPRLRHARARRFVAAARDELWCGFRSCAL